MTTYNNETYRIDDIDETANPTSEFAKKDKSKMSYIDYYRQVCTLRFYYLNCKSHSISLSFDLFIFRNGV